MQDTRHVPLYFHEMDKSSPGFSRNIFNANAYYTDYRGCNIFPHPSLNQQCLGYNKDTMRQIIQSQEETFRHQVRELHRLYTRQRELMDDIKMKEIYMQQDLDLRSQTSKSTFPALLQASYDGTRRFLGFGSVGNIFNEKTCLTSVMDKVEEQPQSSHIGHINSNDSDLSSVKTRDSSPCGLLSEKKSKLFFDLNEPFIPESLMSSSTGSSCVMETAHDDQHMGYAFDLNTIPIDFPSETEVRHKNIFLSKDSEEKLDLVRKGVVSSEDTTENKNSDHGAVLVDGFSNHDGNFTKAKACTDMKTDLEKGLEPIPELDRVAAETLVEIFSSSIDVITDDSLKALGNSLSWFADIVSSLGDDQDQENKIHDQSKLVSSERTEDNHRTKPSSKMIKRKSLSLSRAARDVNHPKGLKTDVRTNVKKHRAKIAGPSNVRKPESSALKLLDTLNKRCVLPDWGQVKQRGGFRRRRIQVINSS